MSLMPPRLRSSLSISRRSIVPSFLPRLSSEPLAFISVRSARRLIDWRTVLKLVSMPPSQRWFTNGMPARTASFWMGSRAERLVPTNSTVPPSPATALMKLVASTKSGCVFSRLMMWILLRSPKMYSDILGFQKRVWCPKWTPASSICRMDTLAIVISPCRVGPPRILDCHPSPKVRTPSSRCIRCACGLVCQKRPRFIPCTSRKNNALRPLPASPHPSRCPSPSSPRKSSRRCERPAVWPPKCST